MFGVNRNFKNDIGLMKNRLESMQAFSFSKFADGEWSVMEGKSINNGEFSYDNNSKFDNELASALIDSFRYKNYNYYVGISCPCCQNIHIHNKMKKFSGQDESHLTWANIWVNSNYEYYLKEIVPLYSNYNIHIVANENSNFSNLPFKPNNIYKVSNNAWSNSFELINSLKNYICDSVNEGKKNYLFLFCCGPFGNILCHRLNEFYSGYTYLDIGSTLNPYLQTGFFRGYYRDFKEMKDCVWD